MGKKHDSNLIITLLAGYSLELIKLKCNNVAVIELKFDENGVELPPSDEDKQKIRALRGNVCVYLLGHGGELNGKKLSILQNEKQQSVSYKVLARLVSTHIERSAVTKLEVKVYSCYAAAASAESVMKRDSYAHRLFRWLKSTGINEIELIASPDLFTISMHPTTKKVFTYLGTEIEIALREQFKEEQLLLLQDVRVDFLWSHFSSFGFSLDDDKRICDYSAIHLSPERLKTREKIDAFIAELCHFLLLRMFVLESFERPLVQTVMALVVMKEHLASQSISKQEVLFDKTLAALKQANYSRPYAKLFFKWDGEKEEVLDYYNSKRMTRSLGSA